MIELPPSVTPASPDEIDQILTPIYADFSSAASQQRPLLHRLWFANWDLNLSGLRFQISNTSSFEEPQTIMRAFNYSRLWISDTQNEEAIYGDFLLDSGYPEISWRFFQSEEDDYTLSVTEVFERTGHTSAEALCQSLGEQIMQGNVAKSSMVRRAIFSCGDTGTVTINKTASQEAGVVTTRHDFSVEPLTYGPFFLKTELHEGQDQELSTTLLRFIYREVPPELLEGQTHWDRQTIRRNHIDNITEPEVLTSERLGKVRTYLTTVLADFT